MRTRKDTAGIILELQVGFSLGFKGVSMSLWSKLMKSMFALLEATAPPTSSSA